MEGINSWTLVPVSTVDEIVTEVNVVRQNVIEIDYSITYNPISFLLFHLKRNLEINNEEGKPGQGVGTAC